MTDETKPTAAPLADTAPQLAELLKADDAHSALRLHIAQLQDELGKAREEWARERAAREQAERERDEARNALATAEQGRDANYRSYQSVLEEREVARRRLAAAESTAQAERSRAEALQRLADKVNEIRNSIIGLQTINWSEHVYPLVAALDEAGIKGEGYPEARKRFGTMLERTNAAESRAEALAGALREIAALECVYGDGCSDITFPSGRKPELCGVCRARAALSAEQSKEGRS